MIRGVSWALAICTATSSEPKVKTMKDSIAATNICSTFWTTSMSSCHLPLPLQPDIDPGEKLDAHQRHDIGGQGDQPHRGRQIALHHISRAPFHAHSPPTGRAADYAMFLPVRGFRPAAAGEFREDGARAVWRASSEPDLLAETYGPAAGVDRADLRSTWTPTKSLTLRRTGRVVPSS